MTIMMTFGRSVSQNLFSKSHHVLTRLNVSTTLLRVSYNAQSNTSSKPGAFQSSFKISNAFCARSYATSATGKSAGRPKAHTGRSTAKKSTTKPKKRTKVAKTSKKKPGPKPKAKTKPKPKRKALSATALKRAAAAKRKDLKTRALLEEPKKLPENAWTVYFVENKKSVKISDSVLHTRQVASDYKSLSPSERERLNHTANENKATNDKNYKQWVSKFTPAQIKEANQARKVLSAQKKVATKKPRAHVSMIKDKRLVKRPRNAYSFFNAARYYGGDFKHMTIKEVSALISREWKNLNTSSKQVYLEQAEQDRSRYIEEFKSTYGKDPIFVSKGAKSS